MSDTVRGFPLRCPACGEQGAVQVYLYDVANFACALCQSEWHVSAVESRADWWECLAWLRTAPQAHDDDGTVDLGGNP
jgi:hypothetical protein